MPDSQQAQSEQLYTCECHEVVVNDRQRKQMNKKKLTELRQSIQDHGQLQPGICRLDEEGSPILVFGERRLKACLEAGLPFTYRLKENMSDDEAFEIELIENIYREDLSWQDKSEALLKLHELRQTQKGSSTPGSRGGHGVRDTAEEIGMSVGIVQEDVELAMFAREIPEVAEAANKTVAKNIIKRIKEEITREEALDEALEKATQTENEAIATSSDNPEDQISLLEARLLEYDKRCLLGNFEDCGKTLESGSFELVCFDPPWGVGLDLVSKQTGSTKPYEDEQSYIHDKLPGWLSTIFSLMAEDSHLYLFFGIVHHQLIYNSLESAGFTTNRMPLFWKKRGAHRTRNPEIWPGRCYEAIAYARKGSKPLARMGQPDIIETQAPTHKMKLSHPSAKHPDIYRDLIMRSCKPGDKVLDPMAGSGMFGVACESCRAILSLDWTQIEMDSDYRVLQLTNLHKGYSGITLDTLSPEQEQIGNIRDRELPEVSADFKQIEVGSSEWMSYWKNNPADQDAMMEWKAQQVNP